MVSLKFGFMLFGFVSLSCSGTRPEHLGLVNGAFLGCEARKNCVSSFAQVDDAEHHIDALQYISNSMNVADAKERIKLVLEKIQDKHEIISEKNDYIHLEFTSGFLRFVDDVELYFPAGVQNVHIKSASRFGFVDFGGNRSRMENIRLMWHQL